MYNAGARKCSLSKCPDYAGARKSKSYASYQVIEVSSINGHARLVPQVDHKDPGVQFWLDDALPDLLRT
jgi:hypothetical protein